ncbi:MAG: alpha/beta hydrolase [Chloroflexi bacterium]|nr:alpha/beta hydrolase [Chloroflexota bacterium]
MLSSIPHKKYNKGHPLLFAHANGYPPDCYTPLFDLLSDYQINAIRQRPLWDNAQADKIKDWHPLSDDLLRFMDEQKLDKPIAIGHSMGGIAILRAALREPERFSRVILLDPVLFPPYFIRLYKIIRALNLAHKTHPLVPAAQRRRRVFNNREMMIRGYRKKRVFRYFSDKALQAYVNGITCPLDDGRYQLCYSAEWEVQIYVTGVWRDMELWQNLPNLTPPLLIIRGAETDTFYESAAKLVKKKLSSAKILTIPKSTHLLPLEEPEAVANEIRNFIKPA